MCIRDRSCAGQRIWEAYRLGFHTCIVPEQDIGENIPKEMNVVRVRTIADAIRAVL